MIICRGDHWSNTERGLYFYRLAGEEILWDADVLKQAPGEISRALLLRFISR